MLMKFMHSPQLKSRVRTLSALVAASIVLPALAYAGHDNDKNSDRGNDLDSFFGSGPAFFGTKSFSWKGDRIEPLLNCRDLQSCRFLREPSTAKTADTVSGFERRQFNLLTFG